MTILKNLFTVIFGAFLMMFLFLAVLTPEYNEDGNHTEFFTYWFK